MNPISEKKRTRNRVSYTCSNCRNRRLKCDRKRPFCGRCELDGCTETCTYNHNAESDSPESKSTKFQDLENKVKKLEEVISYQKKVIDDFRGFSVGSLQTSLTSLDSSSLERPVTSSIPQIYNGYSTFDSTVIYSEPTSPFSLILEDSDLSAMFQHFIDLSRDHKVVFPEPETVVSNFSEGTVQLPKVKSIEVILDYTFDLFDSFISFLDKFEIRSSVSFLVEEKGDHGFINLSEDDQGSSKAILMLLLRLASLAVSPETLKFLNVDLNVTISESYVHFAANLLMSPQSFKSIKFNKIQGLLLLLVYGSFSPENYDCHYSTSILIAALVQSCRVMGLSRGVSQYPRNILSESDTEKWQSIWIYVCYLDASFAFDRGVAPVIHISEIENLPKHFSKTNIANNNHLKSLIALNIRTFLDGKIKEREIDEFEIETLLRGIASLLNSDCKTVQQLKNKGLTRSVGGSSIRAEEFLIRINLLYKEFRTYYLLYASNASKRSLSLSFERCLVLFRMAHDQVVQLNSYFGEEIDSLVFPRLWISLGMIIPCIVKVIKCFRSSEISLIDCFKYFNSSDSTGIMEWIEIDFRDEEGTLKRIIRRIFEVCNVGLQLSSLHYACLKSCIIMMYNFDCIHMLYPDDEIKQFIDAKRAEYKTIFMGWKKKESNKNLIDTEELLKSIGGELDDYFQAADEFWFNLGC